MARPIPRPDEPNEPIPTVHVSIDGGVAADVSIKNTPYPLRIIVKNYDIEGVEESRLEMDEHGEPCLLLQFKNY